MGVNSLPKTVTRQRRGCDLNPGLLRLSPAREPLGYRAIRLAAVNEKTNCNRQCDSVDYWKGSARVVSAAQRYSI